MDVCMCVCIHLCMQHFKLTHHNEYSILCVLEKLGADEAHGRTYKTAGELKETVAFAILQTDIRQSSRAGT